MAWKQTKMKKQKKQKTKQKRTQTFMSQFLNQKEQSMNMRENKQMTDTPEYNLSLKTILASVSDIICCDR